MYNILFIGIGKMCFPMAGYLSKKYDVFEEDLIYLRPEVLKRLSTSGRIRNEKIRTKNHIDTTRIYQ